MAITDTVKWMGRSARNRAELVSHQMKDRALQMRLDKTAEENERLRTENRSLKDAMTESHAEHERIMSLLESHRDETETEPEGESHKGRWFMFLVLLAGGAWAWMRSRGRSDMMDWGEPAGTESVGGTGVSSAA